MRILHLDFDDLDSPYAGGQPVRTFEINRRLVSRGHEIKVITLDYKGGHKKTKEGIIYERTGSKKAYPLNIISYFGNISAMIKNNEFDLIVEETIPPFSFGLSPMHTTKPVISQVQGLFAKSFSKKLYIPFWTIEKFGAKMYDNFIVLTNTMKNEIHKLNKKAHIAVIPNGINLQHDFEPNHKNYALFLGRIEFFQKGIDFLLESAKILLKKAPGFKIIIAGSGLYAFSKKLQKIIEKENLTNIEYVGKIIGTKKEKMIRDSMMLLLPSRFEIFPFTMLEAAAYGKPIICFNIKNIDELMANKIGIAAQPFHIKEYTNAILHIINNKKQRLEFAKNSYKWAENHLWDTIVDTQEKFYFDCIERGKYKSEKL